MRKYLDKIKKVYAFWGKFPWLYAAQDYITFMGRPRFIRRRATQKLHLHEGDSVLEVACGNGRNCPYLIEAVGKSGRLVSFDYSEEMLSSAENFCARKGWRNVQFIQGDAAILHVGGEKFDGVFSVLGISAIPDWEAALRRCYEVLQPGGRLCICDARLFHGPLRFLNPIVKMVYSRFAAWDASKNIPEAIREIFGNVEVESFNAGTIFIAVSVKRD